MCDIKNKSLAKRKPHLYQKQFTISFLSCSQLSIRWMQSVLRAFKPVLQDFQDDAVLRGRYCLTRLGCVGALPGQDCTSPGAQLNPDWLHGQETSLKPHPPPLLCSRGDLCWTSSSGLRGYRAMAVYQRNRTVPAHVPTQTQTLPFY